MRKKLQASKLLTTEEAKEDRKKGLIFKIKNKIELIKLTKENEQKSDIFRSQSEKAKILCRKLHMTLNDLRNYKKYYSEYGERKLRSILIRHGFNRMKSDLIFEYLKNDCE
ncbi:hypothetical protein TUBRATIS_006250 [Tubulinosema ratisbonensis]|uniref:Uncharacterized protein n=1 Tax=Tubulinosema ratisbonensis TaxID=291195 RepID=A0A437APA0_9MICR|nr:hypothetical protein TUBRATIS_006250 [Tubulinosema ratisbonensis]